MKNTIKTLRDNLGMTQDQLAQKLDVTQGAVAQWEAGLSKPEIGRLPKLAKVLGVTVDDLLRLVLLDDALSAQHGRVRD